VAPDSWPHPVDNDLLSRQTSPGVLWPNPRGAKGWSAAKMKMQKSGRGATLGRARHAVRRTVNRPCNRPVRGRGRPRFPVPPTGDAPRPKRLRPQNDLLGENGRASSIRGPLPRERSTLESALRTPRGPGGSPTRGTRDTCRQRAFGRRSGPRTARKDQRSPARKRASTTLSKWALRSRGVAASHRAHARQRRSSTTIGGAARWTKNSPDRNDGSDARLQQADRNKRKLMGDSPVAPRATMDGTGPEMHKRRRNPRSESHHQNPPRHANTIRP
jgi:hypothetical protein